MHIFPNRFVSEHDGSSCILVDAERSRTVLLIPAATSSTATWVCEENEIQAAVGKRDSVVERRILNDTIVVAEIQLPSGGKVVMIPPTLVQTREGRRELMSLLNRPLTDVPSGPESNGETESEKTAQEERMNEDSAASVGPGVSESLPTATLPKFTSLDVQLLRKAGKFDPNFPTNSRNPVEFETDLFKGKVLLLIRPTDPDEDPYWSERLFAKKKRNVVLQIQGKFKRKPKGKLFLGAEISQKMKVGLLTRGLLGLLIRCLERFFSDLRYSFGDTEGLEMPRVAAPAHSSFERVAVTPRGEVPPTISEDPFPESKEASSARRKAKNWDWNMEDTYSMTYYSMYIDLPTWHLVNLPMSGDINLRTLWSDSFLRIVLYEKTGKQQPHLQKYNNYAFAIQVTYFGDKDQSAEEELEDEERDNIFRVSDRSRLLEREESEGSEGENHSAGLKRLDSQSFPALMLADSDGEDFYDAEETSVSLVYEQSASDNDPAVSVDLLVTIDSIVPAWLDVVSNRGGYCRTFAIVVGLNVTFRSVQACELAIGDSGAQRRVSRLVDENFSPRMSTAERMRRMLGLVLVNGDQNSLRHFKREQSDFDATFLKRAPTPLSEKKHSIIRVSGFVARAVSDRHWIEEWAKITDCNISFYHPEKRKPHFRITISSIMRTERMEPGAFPHLPGFCFLVVETVGRSVYLMFSSETDCNAWLEVILRVKMLNQNDDRDSVASQDTSSPQLMEFDNPAEEFLHKSSMWNVKNRRILNCGQFCFRAQVNVKNPLILAEEALRLALNPSSDEDYQRRRQFLSSAAVLKRANVRGLPEESRLAFFLNVYHTMIMHAFLVLGPPGSSLKWIGYFNNIAYEVGDDVFSLTELEHCIIRSKMAYPSQFISRFVLPKSQYAFALTKADYRINFALNCGSTSNPSCIFIFRPERLNEQLDAACRLYLSSVVVTVQKSSREVYVQLPRVCQWFSEDFGTQTEMISKIQPYLKTSERQKLSLCWATLPQTYDMSAVTVRYKDYSFQCRPLTLLPGTV